MSDNEYEDSGWFYGYAPTEQLDDKGKTIYVDSRNVVGRFVDSKIINVPKSEKAEEAVYDSCIILETRLLTNAFKGNSQDIAAQIIRFSGPYKKFSVEATKRFKEAWTAYNEIRKTLVTKEEHVAVGTALKVVATPKRVVKRTISK